MTLRRSPKALPLAGDQVVNRTSLSCADSAPQTSPVRPRSCRTSALRVGQRKTSKRSVVGSKRTSASRPKSLIQTTSSPSTYTAYGCDRPGRCHSCHAPLAGSYRPIWPAFPGATRSKCRSARTRSRTGRARAAPARRGHCRLPGRPRRRNRLRDSRSPGDRRRRRDGQRRSPNLDHAR